MRIAVLKLGSRISFNSNDTSGGNGEARAIIKMLKAGGAEVHIITKILSKDVLVEDYFWHDILDLSVNQVQQFDAVVVLNGNVNFFGGQEDAAQLKNYELINAFNGKVFYVLCDPELTFTQVWPSVSKKEWASKWSSNQLMVSRTDIVYLVQPHDVDKVVKELKKNEIVPATAVHFPFEQFPCLNEVLPFNEAPEVDLSYGGTMRNGRRVKKMIKFYFGHPENISVEMFGKISAEDFSPNLTQGLCFPKFTGPVKYDQMLKKMNNSVSHCVIGDPWYEEINDIPQRLYESIWSGVITFIDNDMDKVKRVWKNDAVLGDFLYVNGKQELSEKINLIKADTALRKQLYNDQINAVNFNAKKYCESFVSLIDNFRK
jgi:hypothetical protein